MAPRDSDFFKLSKKLAEEFLQSTVIIDDFIEQRSAVAPERELDRTLEEPLTRHTSPADERNSISSLEIKDERSLGDIPTDTHYLNAKRVIDAFARKRIVCSVINPVKEDRATMAELITSLADCTDILIVDWSLHDDDGEKALEILTDILRPDAQCYPTQLRLFVIYSGSPDVATIAGRIRKHLETAIQADIKDDGDFALSLDASRIIVLAKPGTHGIPEAYQSNVISFENLADRVTDEFTELTSGLVSNVAIAALSQIRKNTSKVLNRFVDDLDAPYLSHRFMLPDPADAEAHLTALVAAEILGILEEAQVGRHAGKESISAWLRAKGFSELEVRDRVFSFEDVLAILQEGLRNQSRLPRSWRDDIDKEIHKLPLTSRFQASDTNDALDERFSHLTMMRSHYLQTVPILGLGTIIKSETDYYVCVMPRCDCVRVHKDRNFPFLPLKPPNGPFDTVLLENARYLKLQSNYKPYNLKMIPFKAEEQDHGVILAHRDAQDEEFYFQDVAGQKYKWLGDLRAEHALRLSDEFSAVVGRVGLQESEWLRRWARH